jgi:hypothetical protein
MSGSFIKQRQYLSTLDVRVANLLVLLIAGN